MAFKSVEARRTVSRETNDNENAEIFGAMDAGNGRFDCKMMVISSEGFKRA
ncbi:hypothetical protein R2A130_2610 [Ahrensia sp. R2A130]|nr:hypothetical protein R2A130_2610 [Ahrensia sp. R2A130]